MNFPAKSGSEYNFTLKDIAKTRYEEKLADLCFSDDLLLLKEQDFDLTADIKKWPDLSFADILCYLINFPSQYTKSSLKAYKSLESYKYVLSRLVFNVMVKKIHSIPPMNKSTYYLVTARVRHGQKRLIILG